MHSLLGVSPCPFSEKSTDAEILLIIALPTWIFLSALSLHVSEEKVVYLLRKDFKQFTWLIFICNQFIFGYDIFFSYNGISLQAYLLS